MSVSNRVAQGLLERIGLTLWGFRPNLMQDIVSQNGSFSSVSWFARNMPTYENILKAWGPIRTHLIASEISVLNGCPYCTYGHAYAMQLHYFKQTGQLMSADENEIVSWHKLSEEEIIARFRDLIELSEIQAEGPFLDRMLALSKGNQQPETEDDGRIMHLIQMFAYLNACGIEGDTSSDEAHDPINKDQATRRAYAQARGQSNPHISA